jgi:leader peptidase (prepilin peptidase)/N-methyltransferase
VGDAVFVVCAAVLGGVIGWLVTPQLARFDSRIATRWPVLEISGAVLFGVAAQRYAQSWRVAPVLVLVTVCMMLTVVDLIRYRLPNAIVFPGLVASVAVIAVGEIADGDTDRIAQVAVGALVYGGVLLLVHLVNPAGLGFGDVKLALLLGAFLGWVADGRLDSVRSVMIGLLIGSLLGLALGLARMLAVRIGADFLPDPIVSGGGSWHKTTFPFGPPLMAGAVVVVLWPATFLG